MKSYTITVNGNVYDVTVEEGTSDQAAAAVPAKAPEAPKAAAPKGAAAPAPAPKAKSSGTAGSVLVTAPMPGKILAVKTEPGAQVKSGEVIMVLEAMKMENDIVAPQDGTIASVDVSVGDSVESGSTLATMN